MSQERPLFSRGALVFIGVLGIGSLLLTSALLWTSSIRDHDDVESGDADSFSHSAIGHRALRDVLDMHDVPYKISRYRSYERVRADRDILLLAEPHILRGDPDLEPVTHLRELIARSPHTLLVLPKRDGFGQPFHAYKWLESSFYVTREDVQHTLAASGISATLVRTERPASDLTWSGIEPYLRDSPVPEIQSVQLLAPSPAIEPIIATEYGVLLGRTRSSLTRAPVLVLSDPDMLANHGLHRGPNDSLVRAILKRSRPSPDGRIIWDEVIHGHERVPSLTERLSEPPLLFATLQVLLLMLGLLWASVLRFGPPLPVAMAGRAAGKAFMITNTAELLTFGGHSAHSVERYVWMVFEDLATALNAPAGLARRELLTWLDGQAETRGIAERCEPLAARAARYAQNPRRARPKLLLGLALKVDRFRREMTHESGAASADQ